VVEIPSIAKGVPLEEKVAQDTKAESLAAYQLNEQVVAEKLDLVKEESADVNPWFKYSALSLLVVSLVVSGFYFYSQYQKMLAADEAAANEQVLKSIEGQTFYAESPIELPAIEVRVVKRYNVVAGSFRSKANAERRISALADKGVRAEYRTSQMAEDAEQTMHHVAYKSFTSYPEAQRYLDEIKSSIEPNAWILVDEIEISE
jgi:hypothetical protein